MVPSKASMKLKIIRGLTPAFWAALTIYGVMKLPI